MSEINYGFPEKAWLLGKEIELAIEYNTSDGVCYEAYLWVLSPEWSYGVRWHARCYAACGMSPTSAVANVLLQAFDL